MIISSDEFTLDRNSAYNYWTIDLPSNPVSGNFTNNTVDASAAIVKAGYLVRTVESAGSTLAITGDLNATTLIEVIGGAPSSLKKVTFNGKELSFNQSKSGVVTATAVYAVPEFSIPDLSKVGWKAIDSLPEISSGYDDSLWTEATLTYTNNTIRNLTTPTSLYSSDYGYHYGSLLYRGHFKASGAESAIYLLTEGGYAYGFSAWLNSTFIGSFDGYDAASIANTTFTLPNTIAGADYVITVLIDTTGQDEDYTPGEDAVWQLDSEIMKNPRGILDYNLIGRNKSAIAWKLTGNFGGEDYADRTRGPLNEGGLFAERQGYHLPGAPINSSAWTNSPLGPATGITKPGVTFYSTTFDLDIPAGYDIPIAITFTNTTELAAIGTKATSYRAQIYVNGYQYGKYIHNIGPQDTFPVPQGIWDYNGSNYLGVSLWALEEGGAKVGNLSLTAGPVIQSGFGPVTNSPFTGWTLREGAY